MNANAAFTETSAKGDALLGPWGRPTGSSLHDRVAAWGKRGELAATMKAPRLLLSRPLHRLLKVPDYEPGGQLMRLLLKV